VYLKLGVIYSYLSKDRLSVGDRFLSRPVLEIHQIGIVVERNFYLTASIPREFLGDCLLLGVNFAFVNL
jgi:hypothetical protein